MNIGHYVQLKKSFLSSKVPRCYFLKLSYIYVQYQGAILHRKMTKIIVHIR